MFAPRLSLPWNKRYRYTFGDLVVTMSSSRSISLAGRILLKQYIKDCVASKSEYCHWSNEHLFILDNYNLFFTFENLNVPLESNFALFSVPINST